jgi:17beta-estradiol 17-dehydrogenase / very-long-chain 3-oxoacyl-CoA reductase
MIANTVYLQMARLSSLLIPLLSRNLDIAKGERSLVLSMSSLGMFGIPWLAMYSATKGFNASFGVSLAREFEASPSTRHLDSLVIVPGDVRSQGNSQGIPEYNPLSDDYGKMIVERVDWATWWKMRTISPFWLHDIQARLLEALPEANRTAELTKMLNHKRDCFNAVYEKSR